MFTGGWLAGAIALLTLALRVLPGPRPIDDAYITFRYARNAVGGLGLVYNPGQSVLGTSTPLFAILLASIARLGPLDVAWAAVALSAAADAATAVLIFWLGSRFLFPRWAALLCALAWSVYPVALRYAVGGMETSLAALLALGACGLHLSRRPIEASVLAGLAILARPDMLALAAVLLVAQGLEAGRIPHRSILTVAAVLSPWICFAVWRYGTPVPQSLYAKAHAVYRVPGQENLLQVLYYASGIVLAGPAGVAARGLSVHLDGGWRAVAIAVGLLVLGVWAIGAVGSVRADRRLAVLFALPLVFFGAYALVGLRGGLMAEWYLVPLAPVLFLGLFAGIVRIGRTAPAASGRAGHRLAVVLAVLVVGAQLSGFRPPPTGGPSVLPRIVDTEREDLYRQAGEFLAAHAAHHRLVAASEIGALGYYCDCRILDTVGLISPESLRYYPLSPGMYAVNYAVPPELIRRERPDYFVSLDVFTRRSLEVAPWFQRDYEMVWEAATPVFGGRRLAVFARRQPR